MAATDQAGDIQPDPFTRASLDFCSLRCYAPKITVYMNSIWILMRWRTRQLLIMSITASAVRCSSKRSMTAGPNRVGSGIRRQRSPYRGTGDNCRSIISYNNSPMSPSAAPSTPIRGASTAASTAMQGPATPIWSSPGLDFETRLFAKLNAAELLRRGVCQASYQPQTIVLGANTDPYQPIEASLPPDPCSAGSDAGTPPPGGIITKSAMIPRPRSADRAGPAQAMPGDDGVGHHL